MIPFVEAIRELPPKAEPPVSTGRRISHDWRLRVAAFVIPVGFLPLLALHAWGLATRPHYHFLALLPPAMWMLLAHHDVDERPNWRGGLLAILGLLTALLGAAAATWLTSPWLAAVTAVACAPAWLWTIGGATAVRKWGPAWVITWIAIPLPFGMDQDLIVKLRSVTTRLSSIVLDQLGILHLSYGNVIELPHKSLFIADACSGIHSLYVLLGAGLFIGLWFRRSWLHICLLMIFTVGLVLIENVSRIVAVAFCMQRQIDLSTGLPHNVLGFALFVGSLVLILSGDRLVSFLVAGVNSWTSYGRHRVRLPAPHPAASSMSLLLAIGFLPVGIAQAYQLRGQWPGVSEIVVRDVALPELGADALPAAISRFERKEFASVARVHGDPFGQASQQWIYATDDGLSLIISVDYPYHGLHDLSVCYAQTGWSISEKKVLSADDLAVVAGSAEAPVAMSRMKQSLNGNGLLLFSQFDPKGHVAALIKDLARGEPLERIWQRLEASGDSGPLPTSSTQPPYLQIQLFARTHRPLTPEHIDELMQLYVQVRRQLIQQCLTAIASE